MNYKLEKAAKENVDIDCNIFFIKIIMFGEQITKKTIS